MKLITPFLALFACVGFCASADAEDPVRASQSIASVQGQAHVDPRIVTLRYRASAVFDLEGCQGLQSMIVFGADEHIANVGLGDASDWQVVQNNRGDLLFVRPLAGDATSNLTVVTDRRVYDFKLHAAVADMCEQITPVYQMRFTYMEDDGAEPDERRRDGPPKR